MTLLHRAAARAPRALAAAGSVLALAACAPLLAPLLGARPLRTAIATAAARPREARAGTTSFHTMPSGGRARSYLLHLPPGFTPSAHAALVVVLHGYRGNANTAMLQSRMNNEADRRGVVVAYPNGTGALRYVGLTWNAGTCCGLAQAHRVDDVGYVADLVDTLATALGVDRARVYVAGFSAGGTLAIKVACERPALVAGVADVEGAMADTTCAPARHVPVPVMLFEGTEDDELRADLAEARHRNHHAFALSMPGALRFWAAHDGCAPGLVVTPYAGYTTTAPPSCPSAASVRLVTVQRHEHAWPGGRATWLLGGQPAPDVPGSALILDFFAVHRRDAPAAGSP